MAFMSSTGLTGLYFEGNAPGVGSFVFYGDTNAIIYDLPGTTNWGPIFAAYQLRCGDRGCQEMATSECGRINLDSTSTGPAGWFLLWKPARTWPILSGLLCKPTLSPATRHISVIPTRRIVAVVSTACVGSEAGEGKQERFSLRQRSRDS
jgi:hypothetical protein